MSILEYILPNLPWVAPLVFISNLVIIALTVPWILTLKRESSSAVAWSLVVILVPLFGTLLFLLIGYTHVYRPLRKKRRHRARFRARTSPLKPLSGAEIDIDPTLTYQRLGVVALKLDAFPVTGGNQVTLYHDTEPAFAELLDAIRRAEHHVHVEFFIIRPDATGLRFLDLLMKKAKAGVTVRLLYDAIGTRGLGWRLLSSLRAAGVKVSPFMPLNPLRRRFQINMRNHRKIVVIDGRIAFTGGMNIADEYLGKVQRFGYWRDEFLRLEGPGVASFQRIFAEDWDFSAGESLQGEEHFPKLLSVGEHVVQVIESGPDKEPNAMRELIFAAMAVARERLWISTPYIVPDRGILDALRMAARFGVDVRLLWLLRPDHQLPFYAARYYLPDLMADGVKVYQYKKGMMHAKMMMVDGKWGWVGSTNLDYRSLVLNFEANCIFHSPSLVAEIETAFQHDLEESSRLELKTFAGRPFAGRMLENGCRLLSPLL